MGAILPFLVAWASAGVWVRKGGEVYVQAAWTGLESTRTFDALGRALRRTDPAFVGSVAGVFDASRYASSDVSLYGEVGLTHGFELDSALPVRFASQRWTWAQGPLDPVVQRNAGFADWTSALRFGGEVGRVALCASSGVHLPLYDDAPDVLNIETGNSDFFDDRVALGPGTIDVDLGGAAGVPLGLRDGWALVEAAVRIRDRGFSEELPGRVQVGLKPLPPLATWVGLDGLLSLGNGPAPDTFLDAWDKGPLAVDDESALTASLGALLELGAGLAPVVQASRVVAGRRYPLATTLTAGLAWHGEVP